MPRLLGGNGDVKLDVGCGYPGAPEGYRKRGDVGVDIERGFCDVVADAHYLPFREDVFKVVGVYTSLDHFFSPWQALKEIHRVLVMDGVLEIVVQNCGWWSISFFKPPREHLYQWTLETLRNLVQAAGFMVFSFGFENWQRLIFRNYVICLLCCLFYRHRDYNLLHRQVMRLKAVKVCL